MKFLKYLFLGLTLTAIIACKNRNSSPDQLTSAEATNPVVNDWIVFWLEANPEILNPVLSTDIYSQKVQDFVFDTLISFDVKTTEPEPKLAESWKVSEDGLTYDFFLRKSAKFHDGQPVTAEDVKFSYDAILDPKIDSGPARNYFANLKKIEVVGPHHIRFTMSEPYFRNLIVLGLNQIMPKHIYGKGDFNTNAVNRAPIGSGPYKFGKWETGRVIELDRFEDYWGKDVPEWKDRYNFKRVIFRIINDPSVAVMALKKREIDAMEPTSSQFIRDFNDPDFETKFYKLQFETEDGDGFGYIGWNLRQPRFASRKTRLALAHLMPRDAINQKLYNGTRILSAGPWPRRNPKMNPQIEPVPFDAEKAKELLAEDGWKDTDNDGYLDKDGKKFSFELLFPAGSSDGEKIALIYQQALKDAGIELNIRTLEWTVFMKNIYDAKFDAYLMGWGSSRDSDPYQIWHSSQIGNKGSNRIAFKNDRADKLMEEARRTLDTEKRNALYHEFTKIVADEAPYLFLFERPSLYIASRRFERVVPPGRLGLDSSYWYTPLGRERYKDSSTP